MVGKLFAPSTADSLKEQWRGVMRSTPQAGVAAALRAMAERPDSFATLKSVKVPTLIVVGEHDVITPPDSSRKMQAALPGSRLEIIPDAGHMAPVEKPEEFAKLLNTFVKALPG